MEPTIDTEINEQLLVSPNIQQPQQLAENYTEQQVAAAVAGALDCVALLTSLQNEQTPTQEQQDAIARNVQHLQIMLNKTWFTQAITSQQLAAIQAVI